MVDIVDTLVLILARSWIGGAYEPTTESNWREPKPLVPGKVGLECT